MKNWVFNFCVISFFFYYAGISCNCVPEFGSVQDASHDLPSPFEGTPPDYKGEVPDFLESLCKDGILLPPGVIDKPLNSLIENAKCLDQLGGWLSHFSCFQDVKILPINITTIPPIKIIGFTVIVENQTKEKGELWVRELCQTPQCLEGKNTACEDKLRLHFLLVKGTYYRR